jgi:hypothetical protein
MDLSWCFCGNQTNEGLYCSDECQQKELSSSSCSSSCSQKKSSLDLSSPTTISHHKKVSLELSSLPPTPRQRLSSSERRSNLFRLSRPQQVILSEEEELLRVQRIGLPFHEELRAERRRLRAGY